MVMEKTVPRHKQSKSRSNSKSWSWSKSNTKQKSTSPQEWKNSFTEPIWEITRDLKIIRKKGDVTLPEIKQAPKNRTPRYLQEYRKLKEQGLV